MDIGQPLEHAMDFIQGCVDAGYILVVCTSRPAALTHTWLKRHLDVEWFNSHPDAFMFIQISPQPPQPGVPYLSRDAIMFPGEYPTIEDPGAYR